MASAQRKICIVTGSRAEYGLLYWLIKGVQQHPDLQLQLIATGMHLSPEFGETYQEIEEDGFVIDEKIPMDLSNDSPVGLLTAMGKVTPQFAEAFQRLSPDLIVVLGDRFELLPVAQSALLSRIPMAHLCGGDTTEGAFDEAIRHSLTKMSHIHFPTNQDSADRIRQLGENPDHIFNFGHLGLDGIRNASFMTRDELSADLDFEFKSKNFLVTMHPVTLEQNTADEQCQALLQALEKCGDEIGLIFTYSNADTGGQAINNQIEEFVKGRSHSKAYTSLGMRRYLSLLNEVSMVVGNSSSGLYEVPSFYIPTINIGDRQKGRLQADSVINCEPTVDDIYQAIQKGLNLDCSKTQNPYGDGHAHKKMVDVLATIDLSQAILKKHFFKIG